MNECKINKKFLQSLGMTDEHLAISLCTIETIEPNLSNGMTFCECTKTPKEGEQFGTPKTIWYWSRDSPIYESIDELLATRNLKRVA